MHKDKPSHKDFTGLFMAATKCCLIAALLLYSAFPSTFFIASLSFTAPNCTFDSYPALITSSPPSLSLSPQKFTRTWSPPWRATPKSMCCSRSTPSWRTKWETSTRGSSASASSATRASLKTVVREREKMPCASFSHSFPLISVTAAVFGQVEFMWGLWFQWESVGKFRWRRICLQLIHNDSCSSSLLLFRSRLFLAKPLILLATASTFLPVCYTYGEKYVTAPSSYFLISYFLIQKWSSN